MSKPGTCHHLSFDRNHILSNFIERILFSYNLTSECQIILKEAIFENEINLGQNYYRKQIK